MVAVVAVVAVVPAATQYTAGASYLAVVVLTAKVVAILSRALSKRLGLNWVIPPCFQSPEGHGQCLPPSVEQTTSEQRVRNIQLRLSQSYSDHAKGDMLFYRGLHSRKASLQN